MTKEVRYRCNDCGRLFYVPTKIVDEENDEEYDTCPSCGSDDYNESYPDWEQHEAEG